MTAGLWLAAFLLALNSAHAALRSLTRRNTADFLSTAVATCLCAWAAYSVWSVIP